MSLFLLQVAAATSVLKLSGDSPSLVFNQENYFTIHLNSDNFLISSNVTDILSYKQGENVYLNAAVVQSATALEIDGEFALDSVKQWQLVHSEDFANPAGWTHNANSVCAGTIMLGGYCQFSDTQVQKLFTELPPHRELKIASVFHFIDAWIGESAYLKVQLDGKMEYVWTENHKAGQAGTGVNVCGGHHAEGKFASNIEVIVPHSENDLFVAFGALLDQDPCDESWGVSVFEVYIR